MPERSWEGAGHAFNNDTRASYHRNAGQVQPLPELTSIRIFPVFALLSIRS
jgi:hypothetical protein